MTDEVAALTLDAHACCIISSQLAHHDATCCLGAQRISISVHLNQHRSTKARKRIALPFLAADTPSERSEFAQPDVALLHTVQSYHHDGLSRSEIQQAFEKLLSLGTNAQKTHYEGWLKLSWDKIPEGDPKFALPCV